jgi:hypothetical protein
MYIYKTTNLLNNKVYIGKSQKLFNGKYYGSGILLKKAIKKYGIENFLVEVIENCKTIEILNQQEKMWIAYYIGNSYNIAEGGTGGNTMSNHPNKFEIYKKMGKIISNTLKGHSVSNAQREKQSKSHTGWFHRMSESAQNEYKEKMSKLMKEKYKNGHHSKGIKLSEERRQQLSQSAKNNKLGGDIFSKKTIEERIEICKKMSKSSMGRVVSDETREKISKTLKNKNKQI